MRIEVELFPLRKETTVDLREGANGFDLTRALGLAPDVHIIIRGSTPIPIDEALHDGDRIRVVAVVSGG